jgi:hypothetical protein
VKLVCCPSASRHSQSQCRLRDATLPSNEWPRRRRNWDKTRSSFPPATASSLFKVSASHCAAWLLCRCAPAARRTSNSEYTVGRRSDRRRAKVPTNATFESSCVFSCTVCFLPNNSARSPSVVALAPSHRCNAKRADFASTGGQPISHVSQMRVCKYVLSSICPLPIPSLASCDVSPRQLRASCFVQLSIHKECPESASARI